MNIYSNKFINLSSLIITIIILFLFNFFSNKLINLNQNKSIQNEFNQVISENKNNQKNNNINNIKVNNSEDNLENENEKENSWFLKINKINLEAPIRETVDMEILNNYIGHFEDTSVTEGNIGLAAHNRGYQNNYFEKLKDLKKGDEIIYQYKDFFGTYIVDKIKTIRNTDWSYLDETEENKLTLITCTDDKPELRLCVQAIKKE